MSSCSSNLLIRWYCPVGVIALVSRPTAQCAHTAALGQPPATQLTVWPSRRYAEGDARQSREGFLRVAERMLPRRDVTVDEATRRGSMRSATRRNPSRLWR